MDASMTREALALIALAATVLAAIANIASLQQSRLRRILFLVFMLASLLLIVFVSTNYSPHKKDTSKKMEEPETLGADARRPKETAEPASTIGTSAAANQNRRNPTTEAQVPAPARTEAPHPPQGGRRTDGREPLQDIQTFLIGEWVAAQSPPDDQLPARNECSWTFIDSTTVKDNIIGYLRQYEISRVQGNEVLLHMTAPYDAPGFLQRLYLWNQMTVGSKDVQAEFMRIVVNRSANQFVNDGKKCVRR
jgi:hypothetical protein